ncbi:hypothetical protein QE152_g31991 [Popillia japonica]|uniref:Uncharacterized protein n=1 Tax=Popillia japonica TaxID=7064 RepID=A0AAW1J0J9_POPJA
MVPFRKSFHHRANKIRTEELNIKFVPNSTQPPTPHSGCENPSKNLFLVSFTVNTDHYKANITVLHSCIHTHIQIHMHLLDSGETMRNVFPGDPTQLRSEDAERDAAKWKSGWPNDRREARCRSVSSRDLRPRAPTGSASSGSQQCTGERRAAGQ